MVLAGVEILRKTGLGWVDLDVFKIGFAILDAGKAFGQVDPVFADGLDFEAMEDYPRFQGFENTVFIASRFVKDFHGE